MKESSYNYVLYDKGWGYWYNALTNAFFRLSENLSLKIQDTINSGMFQNLNVSPTLYKILTENGFLIPDGTNEIDIIRNYHKKAVNRKDYFLVLLPTLNCNYKCWYCIQDHIPSIMRSDVMKSICNHIEYMIVDDGIETLHLDWFGGEPFMFFNQIIKPISEFAIKICEKHNIPFINSATTNGYFINDKVSKQLGDLRFRHFQITLDGEKQFHDKVKFTRGCDSTFDYVLENINRILTDNESIQIFLRINYTHDTLSAKIVEEVNEHISPENRNRIIITPKKVWQERSNKNFGDTLIPILDLFDKSGYYVARRDINTNFTPCYVNQKYYNSINYNGNIVKCTACDDLYSDKPYGKLRSDGRIEWVDNYDKACIVPTFETEHCLKCKKLPACMGLCPRDFMLGNKKCKYDAIDEDFEKSLLDFLKNEYA